ncbi:hypothetical protein niasHS_000634 [Heterodera schachtii]|uniref:Uncharacterized protein n=1 Tax=Heterodera schachtii TaxID=97005 RepID=A0ABD2K5K2_HETSC
MSFLCINRPFSSSSQLTESDEATNWSKIDEEGLHDLMGAHVEWKREMEMEMLQRSQNAKLAAVRNLHDFLLNGPKEPSTSFWQPFIVSAEARAEYDQILSHFEKRMEEEIKKTTNMLSSSSKAKENQQKTKNELDAFKKLYMQILFRFFRELYRQSAEKVTKSGQKGIRRQRAEKEQLKTMNQAFDIVPEISKLKRHCFLGALWLCDGQSVRFFDYLNTEIGCSSLDGPHINYICHIAIAAKEPAILEPLIELTTFLPSNYLHLAKILNSLALIYGKAQDFDKLEQLWRKMDNMKRNVPYEEQSSRMKLVLARIEHFYRTANRKVPGNLLAALKRLSGQPYFISAHAKKRERMNDTERHTDERMNEN